ncbi:hypothetical protein D0Z67_05205 [Streptomyces seoulensis]|uniref:Uncharacterized protein n=1 Tax=Streptomyces seoulensis TaxID=73044 RepID=A0A4P6TSX7_STRSO|nr:hypothetical protein D0Z67_05205 [Streptomyces seoulensis]
MLRCCRDDISPHPQGASRSLELRAHHAVKPGVDAPKNRQRQDSYNGPSIGTHGRVDGLFGAVFCTRGQRCRDRFEWRTSQCQLRSGIPEFSRFGGRGISAGAQLR